MSEEKIGCLPIPCVTCPYRKDVPSGIWHEEEYEKLVRYDAPTMQQPAKLFMCHSQPDGLCTGWVQSHADRDHAFDLLALRLNWRQCDVEALKTVSQSEPAVPLFKTGAAAMWHGMKKIKKPDEKAAQAIEQIERKRKKKEPTDGT